MAENCILCGKCMAVCPLLAATRREELSPRAKADLVRLLGGGEGKLESGDAARLASLCLGCHRCRTACSQGVDVPGSVAVLRAAHPDFKRWLWKTWLSHAGTLWTAGSTTAGLIPEIITPEKFGPLLKLLAGMRKGEGLTPFLDVESFPGDHRGEKVLLFAGCTANHLQRRWSAAAHRLLEGLGMELLPGEFQCCGSGLKGAGCKDEAGAMEAHNIETWRKVGRPKIVTFCASCRAGLLAYEGFADERERQTWREVSVSLSTIARSIPFVISNNAPKRIGYHRPCHSVERDDDLALLQGVFGERLASPNGTSCCGFGGLMRLAAPELTTEVNADCWHSLAGAETVLTGCSACVAQLKGSAPGDIRVGHWLEMMQ